MPGTVVEDTPSLLSLKLKTYVFPTPIVGAPYTLFKVTVGPVL